MKLNNIGDFKDINSYIAHKTEKYQKRDHDLCTLFEFMFSEQKNTFAETTDGYRIKRLSYGECRDKILAIAPTVADRLASVPRGSMVGLYMENSPEWIQLFWALLMCGYRPLLMNTRMNDGLLSSVIDKYGVPAVISDGKQFSVQTLSAQELTLPDSPVKSFEAHWENEIVFMSSGTTEQIKLCVYNGERLFRQVCNSVDIINGCPEIKKHYNGELKHLTILPFYHVFGFIAVYIWFGFYSRTFVFLRDAHPQTLLNTIRKHKVTHIFAVPLLWDTVYDAALRTVRAKGEKTYDKLMRGLRLVNSTGPLGRSLAPRLMKEVRDNLFGDSICFMISGGSGIRPEVLSFFNGIGYHLANGYGMTELGITSVERSNKQTDLNSGGIGTPFRSAEYRINDRGELLVRTGTMAARILQGGIDTELPPDGWFNTKDLATEKKGRYYIQGRVDDLIVCRNGENLNPTLAEGYLHIPNTQGVCIFSPEEGEAALLISTGTCFTPEQYAELHDAAILSLRDAMLDTQISRILITTEPLLGVNDFKLNRRKIARRYKEGALHLIDPNNAQEILKNWNETELQIIACVAEVLKRSPDEISPDADFFSDLGGSSLEYFALIDLIGERLQTDLPINREKPFFTIREICMHFQNK